MLRTRGSRLWVAAENRVMETPIQMGRLRGGREEAVSIRAHLSLKD